MQLGYQKIASEMKQPKYFINTLYLLGFKVQVYRLTHCYDHKSREKMYNRMSSWTFKF